MARDMSDLHDLRAQHERDQAEREQLLARIKELEEMREGLVTSWGEESAYWTNLTKSIKSERDRYKEALEKIGCMTDHNSPYLGVCPICKIIDEALTPVHGS